MKTKNIFKTLVFAILMPAMLFTFACSNINEDENADENADKNGYTLPVTVNVTRQSENPNTKVTYNDNGNQTGYLSFSEGDQLFVGGRDDGAGQFAGLLTWQSAGTFTGTIKTKNVYEGTADELFRSANNVSATLIPCDYTKYNYISFNNSDKYSAGIRLDMGNAYAFSKAEAVEQFSNEYTDQYDNGFDLSPRNAILNFTISGLDPNAEAEVKVGNTYSNLIDVNLNSDASGTLKIIMGSNASNNNDLSKLTLTVNGTAINLGSHELVAGHIYNISRSPLSNAFVNGNTTSIAFGTNLTLSATYNNGSFGAVTKSGDSAGIVTAASMERDGNNIKIDVKFMGEKEDREGYMTIDTVNNTYYSWSNEWIGNRLTLSSITIGGNSITPLPTPAS